MVVPDKIIEVARAGTGLYPDEALVLAEGYANLKAENIRLRGLLKAARQALFIAEDFGEWVGAEQDKEINRLRRLAEKIYRDANNVIYFNDGSDYRPALYRIYRDIIRESAQPHEAIAIDIGAAYLEGKNG